MRKRSNLILTLFLIILLSGCNNISKDIETFENLINNDNYQEAFTIYEENKENDEFLKAAAVSVNDIIEDIKNDFNNEKYNIDEAKANIDNIKKIITDDTYNQTVKYLNELHESKNNFSNAQEKEKLKDYDSALMYYEKVIESDINYSVAKENINIINEKVAEDYKEFVVSLKDKIEVEIDDIEKFYYITYEIHSDDNLQNEPYATIPKIGVFGTLDKEDSEEILMMLSRVTPQIIGKFTKVIFYQEGCENVVFNEEDISLGNSDIGWFTINGEYKIAGIFDTFIHFDINRNVEELNNIEIMLNNNEKDITIRTYISTAADADIILGVEEREKIKEVLKLYKALKYDNSLINELI